MYRGCVSVEKSPLELAALATAAVPGLRVTGLRPPQFSDEVVSVTGIIDTAGNRWTVVCPHDSVGGLGLESQTAVLQRLARAHDAGDLPFDVPRPAGFTRTPEGLRVMVHRDMGGRFMTEEDFADAHVLPASLGRALAALHNLPESVCTGVDLPTYTAQECRERHQSLLDEVATTGAIPRGLWDRWETALEDVALWRFRTAPVHGDLQSTSVVVNDGSVMGVSGFSSMHVGDPAEDVAWVLARASDDFLDRFNEAYSMSRRATDLHLVTRAQLFSELAVARWLAHGMHAEDESVIQDARAMLAELAEDLGDEPLVRTRTAPSPGSPDRGASASAADTESPADAPSAGSAATSQPAASVSPERRPRSQGPDDGESATTGTRDRDEQIGSPVADVSHIPDIGGPDIDDPELPTGPLPFSEAPTETLDLDGR